MGWNSEYKYKIINYFLIKCMILNAVSIPVGNTNVSIKNTDDSSDVIELLHHFIRLLVVRLENILFDA